VIGFDARENSPNFRDFAYCDSGMIPWLLVAELVSKSKRSLSDWVRDRFDVLPSSGEINFRIDDAGAVIDRVLSIYSADALSLDETDGMSFAFRDWRFNLRRSNTEPLVRLNIEACRASASLKLRVADISKLLGGTVA